MNSDRTTSYLAGLVKELRALPAETEWVEFKCSYASPKDIGEYISALDLKTPTCLFDGYLMERPDIAVCKILGFLYHTVIKKFLLVFRIQILFDGYLIEQPEFGENRVEPARPLAGRSTVSPISGKAAAKETIGILAITKNLISLPTLSDPLMISLRT